MGVAFIDRCHTFQFSARTLLKRSTAADMITWMAITVAIISSVLSVLGVCMDACSDTGLYTLFGMEFGWTGIIFFGLMAVIFAARPILNVASVFNLLSFGAVGAEGYFLLVQRNVIGHWCPLCVIVAIAVVALGITRFVVYLSDAPSKKMIAARTVVAACMALIGFSTALAGLGSQLPQLPNSSAAAAIQTKQLSDEDIWMGNKQSNVEIYFISDWYCPYCRKLDKDIEKMLPGFAQTTRITFLDMLIHKQSLRVIPFHSALLINEKSRYMEGRQILFGLTANNDLPAEADIVSALNGKGIQHYSIGNDKVNDLQAESRRFFTAHGVHMTPSVVIKNRLTGKHQLLAGGENISKDKIQAAVVAVGG